LAMHPHGHPSDSGPRIQPRAEGVERTVIRGHGAPGEAERRHEKSAALVEHALFDHLVRP